MMIPEDKLKEILSKSNLEIVSVIGSIVSLKKKGNNYVGLCPFHKERTPSFTVTEHKCIYKCFGCGKGGPVVNFIMEYNRCSFIEAVHYLAKHFNILI